MAAYSVEQALVDLKKRFLYQQQPRSQEPLEGVVDGSNLVFSTRYYPLSGFTLYNRQLQLISSGYSVNDDTGQVVFTTAPTSASAPYVANYTAVQFSDNQLTDIIFTAFDEMQMRWPRVLYLVDSGGSTFISDLPTAVEDPAIPGSIWTFGTSRTQIRAFLACVEYMMQFSSWIWGTGAYYMYRENRSGGLMVDKSKLNDALAKQVEFMSKRLDEALLMAATQYGGAFGSYVPSVKSEVYQVWYDWVPWTQQFIVT